MPLFDCLLIYYNRAYIWGLGIAVVHEILALGTDVRLIQSLLNAQRIQKNREYDSKRLTAGIAFED